MEFRPLTDADLPLMHRWLNEPGVIRWWEGDDVSWDAVVDDYGQGDEADEGEDDHLEHWLAVIDDEPIGWIQCCTLASEPEWFGLWAPLGVDDSIIAIDYLIGDPQARGRGIGSTMIAGFVDQVVFGNHPDCRQVGADPAAANLASWHALERAGFRLAGTYDDPLGTCNLMVLDRP